MERRQYQLCFCAFCFANAGAEVESQPTDSHLLAQCLHAGGLPERHGRAAHPQIPTGYFHTDRRGIDGYILYNPLKTVSFPCPVKYAAEILYFSDYKLHLWFMFFFSIVWLVL